MSGSPLAPSRPLAALLAGVLAVALAAGCGSSAGDRHPAAVTVVNERDFHISAPTTFKAGEVDLQVTNRGPDHHELIIAPLRGGSLPLRPDGFTVDEEAIERSEPGSLEPGAPGAARQLRVHLAPGRYVFFCNMAGHYLGGMHTIVTVTA
jgi:uncharacterized cupredoxin-like copper-binding protein